MLGAFADTNAGIQLELPDQQMDTLEKRTCMKTRHIIILAAIALVFITVLLGYFLVYNKPHPDYEKARPGFTGSAESLYNAFTTDPEGAVARFDDMVIQISGEVSQVESSGESVTVVFHFGSGMFGDEGVRCSMLKGHHERALQLSEGQSVTVRGHFAGFTGSDVVVQHASLVLE